jgi:UPF0716 protein FxsA
LVILGFIAFIAIAEFFVIALAVKAIGVVATILVLVLISSVGAYVARRQGLTALKNMNADLQAGRMPTTAVIDGALVAGAGLLLLLPGFLSDLAGMTMLIPPVRRSAANVAKERLNARVAVGVRRAGVNFGTGFGGAAGFQRPSGTTPARGDVIDLDAEEYFVDTPRGELTRETRPDVDPGPGRSR